MKTMVIRKVKPSDQYAIKEITYRTGLHGEDLTGKEFIEDKELFFLIFIAYYPRCEPEHCFVAVDPKSGGVVGFICGTPDTKIQERRFKRGILPRLVFRLIFYTSWHYPRTLLNLIRMAGMKDRFEVDLKARIHTEYPAHLHINLLPSYQGMGIGSRLMVVFEKHMKDLGVSGIHLETSNHHFKAVPFYKKMGYTILQESAFLPHPILDDFKSVVFGKRLRSDGR